MISESYLNEVGYIFNEKDSYYNFDNWKNNESNRLFVIGLSGSGKSTLALRLSSEYKCDYIEIDKIFENLYKKYFKEELYNKDHNYGIQIEKFIYDKIILYINSIKKRSVIEGIQPIYFPESVFKNNDSFIVMNTSLLLSSIRNIKRNRDFNANGVLGRIMEYYKGEFLHNRRILRDLNEFISFLDKNYKKERSI